MEAIGTNSINSITQHAAAQNSYGLSTSGGLNVKTEEGDLGLYLSGADFRHFKPKCRPQRGSDGEGARLRRLSKKKKGKKGVVSTQY